ncbi:MAG: hypothetical protein AAF206_18795, partial [Bacteroidota bacterium]
MSEHLHSQAAALPPGTMHYIGTERSGPAKVSIYRYSQAELDVIEQAKAEQWQPGQNTSDVSWIN